MPTRSNDPPQTFRVNIVAEVTISRPPGRPPDEATIAAGVFAATGSSALAMMAASPPPVSSNQLVLNVAAMNFGAFPFLNFIKTPQAFVGPANYPSLLNANGYITAAPSSNISMSIKLPIDYSGDWIIDWQGQIAIGGAIGMQIDVGGTAPRFTVVSGGAFVVGSHFQLQLTGTNGRVQFKFNDPMQTQPMVLAFLPTCAPSGFANLRLYRADQENNLLSGEIFNPDYVAQLVELRPRVLRFLDWSAANSDVISLYKYMPPAAVMSYSNDYWFPNAWAGTISGTNVYTVGNSIDSNSTSYVDGEVIHGNVLNGNTGPSTLNRGGLGAKAIVNLADF